VLAIIDYGMGNLRNVEMAFRRLGLAPVVSADPAVIDGADALVLPGVGAFGDAMARLKRLGLTGPIRQAIEAERPFFGICLGQQLLFDESEEMGTHRGLGVLAGSVRRFPDDLCVPHMGWNQIDQTRAIPLWNDLIDHSYAYFVHSYYVVPDDPGVIAATTDYGTPFASVVARGNLYGIQFHPEKSQDVGARILRNWAVASGLLTADDRGGAA
jgi:glutamine amidotransferase